MWIFLNKMVDKSEEKTDKKDFKTLPGFYQDIIGSLLIVFSSSHESMRFNVARDLVGFVDALLKFTRAHDLRPDNDAEKTFGEMVEDARVNIDNALQLYRDGGSPGESLVKLGQATDSLKQIIVLREMISEGFEIRRTNPLNSSSLEGDTESTNYRKIE